jgi:Transposase, Mutator family
MDAQEWTSALVPRYQRRLREVNEAVVATYLAGGNTRRLRGALGPLLKAAPLSKSAVSRVVGTLKAELEAWRTRSLEDANGFGLHLDANALSSLKIRPSPVRRPSRRSANTSSGWARPPPLIRRRWCGQPPDAHRFGCPRGFRRPGSLSSAQRSLATAQGTSVAGSSRAQELGDSGNDVLHALGDEAPRC